MQQVHNLESNEYITRNELEVALLATLKKVSKDETDALQKVINDVITSCSLRSQASTIADSLCAEGARGGNIIYFKNLISLLLRHGLEVGPTGTLMARKQDVDEVHSDLHADI